MRPRDVSRAKILEQALVDFAGRHHPLPGLRAQAHRDSLVEQLVESLRRIEYVRLIDNKSHGAVRADPSSPLFDPLIAAVLQKRQGNLNEAFWLTFLSVHCGKNLRAGWRLTRLIYGGSGDGHWTWARASENPSAFAEWLRINESTLRHGGTYCFGNHRKYETLRSTSRRSTGNVIASYVHWVLPHGDHLGLVRDATAEAGNDPHDVFDWLYHSMGQVMSFGRMAKFDYLTMLGKLELARIEPGIPYIEGATGPLPGARLLFGGRRDSPFTAKQLDALVVRLGAHLHVGMQVMEDAICNWQKSPARFVAFRG